MVLFQKVNIPSHGIVNRTKITRRFIKNKSINLKSKNNIRNNAFGNIINENNVIKVLVKNENMLVMH